MTIQFQAKSDSYGSSTSSAYNNNEHKNKIVKQV